VTSPLLLCARCGAPLVGGERVCPRCRSLQPVRQPIASGAILDRGHARYVVDARVGEGAMGVVWRAWRFESPVAGVTQPARPVALKLLRGHPLRDARELFLREAGALRRLSHPNVVAFDDLFEHEGALVLAIEYVDGETLESIVARQLARTRLAGTTALPCLPLMRAWHYFQQLLGALGAVHALGIVHRDVKPSNVLVRRDGLVKLGDFGIARAMDAQRLASTSEFAPGTGAYMSPEQVLSRPLDGRSDLYAAATVLYEMLAGRTPFSAEQSEFMVRRDQVDSPPPPLRDAVPQAPPVLDALLAKTLAKDPAARFATAIEMGEAFRVGLGIPESPEWRAQAEMARAAKTIAGLGPAASRDDGPAPTLATLRDFVAAGYRTR
jgi:serine/threonine-protein kinase